MKEPSHGLAYIASSLLDNGNDVEIIDAKQLSLKTDGVISQSIEKKPDLIGITAMTPDILWAARIASGIKNHLPQTPVIIGGPHVTALPERTLTEFPDFDIGVVGEGEIVMNQLVQFFEKNSSNLNDIKGIVFKQNGKIITTTQQGFLEDLDSLPFPAWHLFPNSQNRPYPIYATRGCPFKCNFCQRVLGEKVRRRSPENVIREIEWIINTFHATGFWFADETFGLNQKWTKKLLELLKEKGIHQKIQWHAQTRIDLLTEDFILEMKKAGCGGIAFGVESGNAEILEKSGKKINLDEVGAVVSMTKKVGLKTRSFFILGHPYETIETIQDTINFAAAINTDYVSFSVMVPYPGTEIWNLAREKKAGYSYVSENWDDYRKHLAEPLGFESIPPEVLRNYDKTAYLTFYLHNRRWLDLIQFLWEHKASIRSFIFNRIKKFFIH